LFWHGDRKRKEGEKVDKVHKAPTGTIRGIQSIKSKSHTASRAKQSLGFQGIAPKGDPEGLKSHKVRKSIKLKSQKVIKLKRKEKKRIHGHCETQSVMVVQKRF